MKKMKIKKIKTIPIVWVNEKHDTDRDKVPNYRDCNPWNPHEQGWWHDLLKAKKKRKELPPHNQESIDVDYEVKEPKKQMYARYAGKKIYDRHGGYTQKARWIKVDKPEDLNKQYRSGIKGDTIFVGDQDKLKQLQRQELREHMRSRKQQIQDYVDERQPRWKRNVMSGLGLKTQKEKEQLRKLQQYQKIISMERKMGAMPMITHSSADIFGIMKSDNVGDKQAYVDQNGRYVTKEGEQLYFDREGRLVDERGNVYDI